MKKIKLLLCLSTEFGRLWRFRICLKLNLNSGHMCQDFGQRSVEISRPAGLNLFHFSILFLLFSRSENQTRLRRRVFWFVTVYRLYIIFSVHWQISYVLVLQRHLKKTNQLIQVHRFMFLNFHFNQRLAFGIEIRTIPTKFQYRILGSVFGI